MGFAGRWFLGAAVLTVACLLAAACGGDEQEQAPAGATPTASATPTADETEEADASPTAAAPSPTAPGTATSPSSSELSLDDAPYYLDASAVLPGFRQLDPAQEGLSNEYLGLGPEYSEVTAYLSEEPFQTTFMFMHVASGEIEEASARAELRDEQYLEDAFLSGFTESVEGQDVETTIEWSDADVGDAAKLARMTATTSGGEIEVEMLIFLQEQGEDAAAVFIGSMWLPGEPATVDTVTIAREISARIANR
jgi:hypothetical protein